MKNDYSNSDRFSSLKSKIGRSLLIGSFAGAALFAIGPTAAASMGDKGCPSKKGSEKTEKSCSGKSCAGKKGSGEDKSCSGKKDSGEEKSCSGKVS
jgi:hypothetical protein